MAGMKRRYTAARSEDRCEAAIKLRDGSGAQCMRRRAPGQLLCPQHLKMGVKPALSSGGSIRNT